MRPVCLQQRFSRNRLQFPQATIRANKLREDRGEVYHSDGGVMYSRREKRIRFGPKKKVFYISMSLLGKYELSPYQKKNKKKKTCLHITKEQGRIQKLML